MTPPNLAELAALERLWKRNGRLSFLCLVLAVVATWYATTSGLTFLVVVDYGLVVVQTFNVITARDRLRRVAGTRSAIALQAPP